MATWKINLLLDIAFGDRWEISLFNLNIIWNAVQTVLNKY